MLVEDLARMLEVELVLAVHAPGQGGGPVQVVAGDGVLGRAALEDRQLVQLFVDTLARLLGQHLAFQAGAEFVGVGALVVLGDAQLLLDDLQLFLEEEFALVFADLAVDLGGQLLLQARDFHLLAQQRQDLLHPLEDRHGVQHFLQFAAGRGGQGRGEVGERRRVVGTEAVQVVLQFLAVQRVERQQLLDRIDQGHAVGLHFVTGIDRGLRIVHLHHERRTMALDPAPDTYPRQALGDELQLAALARGMVHPDQRAVLGQAVDVEVARIFRRIVHEEQGQRMVVGLGHQFEGFRPGFFVDDHRQHLRREERAIVDRDHVEGGRQGLAGQHQAGAGGLRVADVFGINVLVAHEAPD